MNNQKNIVKWGILNGIVIKNDDDYSVKCFFCNNYRILKTRECVRRALSGIRKCNGCARRIFQKGKNLNGGCKLSMSLSQKRRYTNLEERKKSSSAIKIAMHRPDVRKRHIEALHHSKWVKVRTDKGQLELLNKWNKLGFNFEPNYQIHTDCDLFYIDGYDKEKNVVLEYDSKYHNKPHQKQKDSIRQQKIIDILQPSKFWRFDSVNKCWSKIT